MSGVCNREEMMSAYSNLLRTLPEQRRRWLVTGGAGFIGSHLVENLLRLGQEVVNLDNFATGHRANLEHVRGRVSTEAWSRHRFIQADIREPDACAQACAGVDYVLHHAALGSVPRSIEQPDLTHAVNVTGTLNMLMAARDAGVRRFVYASSSSVYGDDPSLPKREEVTGKCLSPYAASKHVNECYADVVARCYGLETIGLRYFNVFGARQDPEGAYAAVIPRWVGALIKGETPVVYGDGETSRDFCYVANVVQANLLAATVSEPAALNHVYNVALGGRTTLNQLFGILRSLVQEQTGRVTPGQPAYEDFRAGDVRHSQAEILKARTLLGFDPTHDLARGLSEALPWYVGLFAREMPSTAMAK
jgi:UDP-N-acetylglucosamine 4-epimerase